MDATGKGLGVEVGMAPQGCRFLAEAYRKGEIEPDLIFLLQDITSDCRAISNHLRNGAFDGRLGMTSGMNVQGEIQKPLEVLANTEFMRICSNDPRLAALVSEEIDEVVWVKSNPKPSGYLLCRHLLDGSSNLDVNLSVGSIFSAMQV